VVDPVRPTANKSDKSLPTLVTELWELVLAYLKQETLEPLKGLGRFVGFGIAGAAFMSIGLVLLSVALLRVLQIETGTHLTGNWSWAPYGLTLLAVVVVAALAASRIGTAKRKKGGKS
jgi:hypothetical protein